MLTHVPNTVVLARNYDFIFRKALDTPPYTNAIMELDGSVAMNQIPVKMLTAFAPTALTFLQANDIVVPRKIMNHYGVAAVLRWLLECCARPEGVVMQAPDDLVECVQIHQVLWLFGMTNEGCQLARIMLKFLKNRLATLEEAQPIWGMAKVSTETQRFVEAMAHNIADAAAIQDLPDAEGFREWLAGGEQLDACLKRAVEWQKKAWQRLGATALPLRGNQPTPRPAPNVPNTAWASPWRQNIAAAARMGTVPAKYTNLVPAPLHSQRTVAGNNVATYVAQAGTKENLITFGDERNGTASAELRKWRGDRIQTWVWEQRNGVGFDGKAFFLNDGKDKWEDFLQLP
jgi:hypothetical protein